VSTTAPPIRTSAPVLPRNESFPASPTIVSLPPPPSMMSLPPPPKITSAAAPGKAPPGNLETPAVTNAGVMVSLATVPMKVATVVLPA